MNLSKFIGCFLFFSILNNSSSKVYRQVISINQLIRNQWIYMTKFGINKGTGEYEIKGRFLYTDQNSTKTINLDFQIYMDDDWKMAQNEPDCRNKVQIGKMRNEIAVPRNGAWSESFSGSLTQKVRSRIWFFTISDCEARMGEYLNQGVKVELEIKVLNSNNSHFSSEHNNLQFIYLFQGILTSIMLFINVWRIKEMFRKSSEMNYVYLVLITSLISDLVSEFFIYLHYQIYSYDGQGSLFLELVGQIFSVFSQYILSVLLIFVAFGWTVHFDKIEDKDIYYPMMIAMFVFQILVTALGRITDDEPNKYHHQDGLTGIIINIMRLLMWILFLYGVSQSKGKVKLEQAQFMDRIRFVGSIYFLAFPSLDLISEMFVAENYQHRVISIGTTLMQYLAVLLMIYLFTSKRGLYNKINFNNRTIL